MSWGYQVGTMLRPGAPAPTVAQLEPAGATAKLEQASQPVVALPLAPFHPTTSWWWLSTWLSR